MFTVRITINEDYYEITSDCKADIEDFVSAHYDIDADIWISTEVCGVRFGAEWADRFFFGW